MSSLDLPLIDVSQLYPSAQAIEMHILPDIFYCELTHTIMLPDVKKERGLSSRHIPFAMIIHTILLIYGDCKEKEPAVKLNTMAVKLPGFEQTLSMVKEKVFKMKPMLQLTNCAITMVGRYIAFRISLTTI